MRRLTEEARIALLETDLARPRLLRRHRAGNTDERIKRGIHLSINRIAAGLRNSG